MTANQIKKILLAANIELANLRISRDEVEVFVELPESEWYDNGRYVEKLDEEATALLAGQVRQILSWGVFSAGSGAEVLRANMAPVSNLDGYAAAVHY